VIDPSAFVHPKAHVDAETVSLGAGTKVFQFASVTRGTTIGADCVIWPFAMLDGPVIGDRCKVASGVTMGPGFKIGNDCFLGPNVVLANDCWPFVEMTGVDTEKLTDGVHFAVVIDDGAVIGANSTLLPGITIGAGAVVAAGSRVTRSLPPGTVWRAENGYTSQVPKNWREKRMRWARSI
jgi:acetyltransferase-like isoleucine patch superfamily enzyme